MSGTIGAYQQGVFSSPAEGEALDASVVLGNDNNIRSKHNSHDNDATIHIQSSALSSRPAAGTAGRLWVTTDGMRAYLDSGATWNELAYLANVGGTITGSVVAFVGTLGGILGGVQIDGGTRSAASGGAMLFMGQVYADNATTYVAQCISMGGALAAGSMFTRMRNGTVDAFAVRSNGQMLTNHTTFLATSAALANGSSTATATILNAPVAGNPTKWIPINDNGTTRYLPAW